MKLKGLGEKPHFHYVPTGGGEGKQANITRRYSQIAALHIVFIEEIGPIPLNEPWGYGAQWGAYTDSASNLVLCSYRY